MAFRPGDHVHVAAFGRGIVREVRNGGRCLVDVKGRSMVVSETQLTMATAPKRRASHTGPLPVPESVDRSHVAVTIDLHGLTTDQAFAALDAFISDAILAGHTEVVVIHGRSGGRLKRVVQQRLNELPVRGFRVDALNPGATIVSL